MTRFTIYSGQKGIDGLDGADGLSVTDIDSNILDNPLLASFFDNRLSVSTDINFSRTDPASYTDRYGKHVWTDKGTTTNFITYSNDFSQWGDIANRWSIIGSTADPDGGSLATEIELDVDTDDLSGNGEVVELNVGPVTGVSGCISFYIKLISGTVSGLDFVMGANKYPLPAPTGEYTHIVIPHYISGNFIFSINPRGKSGARLALYGVQIEDNPIFKTLVTTTGIVKTIVADEVLVRQNQDGILIEETKTNLVHHSNNLREWTIDNADAIQPDKVDLFGNSNQFISLGFGSIPTVNMITSTDALVENDDYTVSIWAYITGGSMQPMIVSLGGGEGVALAAPSVVGYTRLTAVCKAGPDDTFSIDIESQALNVQLLLSAIQVETGELTSYKQTGDASSTRNASNFNFDYLYNFPSPILPWTVSFGISGLINDNEIKTVFSNGLTGVSEFSVYYQNDLLNVNLGGNIASSSMFGVSRIVITYDSTTVKFYNDDTLFEQVLLTNSGIVGSKIYIGHNGTDEYLNAYLFSFLAYNEALSADNITYLMGS